MTEEGTCHPPGTELLAGLAAALTSCASRIAVCQPAVAGVWAAAARTLDQLSRAGPEAERDSDVGLGVLDGLDPLAPTWLVFDGLLTLVTDHLADGAPLEDVTATDRSLGGLRRLADLLHLAGSTGP